MDESLLSESQTRILLVLEEASHPLSYKEIAQRAGISNTGCRGRISELINKGFDIKKSKSEANITVITYDGNHRHKEIEGPRTYGDLVRSRMESAEDFYKILETLNSLRNEIAPKKKNNIIYGEKTACVVLSDLHFGQIVERNGHEVYNTEKAFERMENLTSDAIKKIKEYDIDNVAVFVIGDTVDGDMIYRNHIFEVEKAAGNQVKDATKALKDCISRLQEAVDTTIEVHAVRGNHGIVNYNNPEGDNWDNIVYDMLTLVFEGNPDVRIKHYTSDEAKFSIMDKNVLLFHGQKFADQISTSSGLRQFRGLCNKHKLQDGDVVFMGHYHEFGLEMDHNKFLVRNGALPNTSEYAWKNHLYSEPMQTFTIFEKGKTYPTVMPLYVN